MSSSGGTGPGTECSMQWEREWNTGPGSTEMIVINVCTSATVILFTVLLQITLHYNYFTHGVILNISLHLKSKVVLAAVS